VPAPGPHALNPAMAQINASERANFDITKSSVSLERRAAPQYFPEQTVCR
jgi:hypothetical protein